MGEKLLSILIGIVFAIPFYWLMTKALDWFFAWQHHWWERRWTHQDIIRRFEATVEANRCLGEDWQYDCEYYDDGTCLQPEQRARCLSE